MNRIFFNIITILLFAAAQFLSVSPLYAEAEIVSGSQPKQVILKSTSTQLEELLLKSSQYESVEGFASYYSAKLAGRRTTSGHRYNPDKMTAAHESLPLGTVVRVVNPVSKQEVHVTIIDRCASKSFHFIDLSRAAAKKIGLWGKGKIKVVIIPLLEEKLEKPV